MRRHKGTTKCPKQKTTQAQKTPTTPTAATTATSTGALHPLCGGAPDMGHCTRYVAVHPNRRGALPTDRVQCPNIQEQTRNWPWGCAQVVDGLFMRLLSSPLGVVRIRWGICRPDWCGCGGGCRSLRSRWRPRCRPELPPVSWTSKLKSREWEAFRVCGCACEA